MADDVASEIARNIVRNIIPLESFGNAYTQGSNAVQGILQRLGITQPPVAAQPVPPLNAPLPRFGGVGPDGQPIIIPPGQGQ